VHDLAADEIVFDDQNSHGNLFMLVSCSHVSVRGSTTWTQ